MTRSKGPQDEGRRGALKKIALGAGGVVSLPILGQSAASPSGAHAAHQHPGGHAATSADANWKPLFFDDHQNETVIAVTDLIIPQTDTPGAKAAQVNRYIDLVLSEEEPAKQKRFIEGLAWIEARSRKLHGKPFVRLTPEEQTALLVPLADPGNKDPEDRPGVEFFQEIKDMTIFAYYTSEIGMNQELEYCGDDYHADYPGACTHPEHQS